MKTLLVGLLMLCCSPIFGQVTDPERIVKGNFYALIIGVADYEDANVKDLENPVSDARNLRRVLTEKYNFEANKIHFLENPTQDAVYEKLEFFKKNLQENDVWLVFFAGHGFWDKSFGTDGEGYWMLRDSYKNRRNTWLSNTDLKNYIASVSNQHTLIIADACFSGGLVREENFMEDAEKDIKTAYKDKSRIAMTSGSLEPVPDKSVFFKYLIQELEKNEGNYLRALNLFVKIDKLVRVNADTKPIFAPIHKVGHEFGDFVFIRKTDSKALEEAKRQEALQKQQELAQADETAWTKAKNANTIQEYENYLKPPNGKYRYEAQTAKTNIENAQKAEKERLAEEAKKRDLPTNETFIINGVKFEMVYVEGGTFQMGSNDGEADEKPIHAVTLDGFWIGKTEVTQAQWKAVMGTNSSVFKGDDLPVEQVSWNDCQEYITKLNAKTGKKYSLPTEAQWEYAARGGKKSQNYKYAGSNTIDDVAWYSNNSGSKTHEVGTKKANELGLYDMTGNVWEWCMDWYDAGFYASAEAKQKNPINNLAKKTYILRGGSWYNDYDVSRVANRSWDDTDNRLYDLGFRFLQVK